jgi:ABC transport system ATP-binding/permease protein
VLTEKLNAGGHHEELTAWARDIQQLEAQIAQKTDRWLALAVFI